MFTEQGSCLITSVVAMDDTLLSSETNITVTPPPCSSVARPACIPGTAWPYNFESHANVIPSEAMQHTELLGRDSWVRSSDRSYFVRLVLARAMSVPWEISRYRPQGSMGP